MAGNSEGKGNAGGGIESIPSVLQSQEEQNAAKSEQALQAAKEGKQEVEEKTFYKEEEVPEGLKPTFKELQKAYTQKTQEIADVKKRAEAFNELMENPRTQSLIQDIMLGEPGEGAPGAGSEGLSGAEAGGFESEEDQKMKDIESRQDNLEEQLAVSKCEADLDKLAAKHDDFDQLLPKMRVFVEQGDSYESAYCRAKFGGSDAEAKKQMRAEIQKEMEAEKKAKLEGVGPSGGMLSPTAAKTVEEAFEQAKEKHKTE